MTARPLAALLTLAAITAAPHAAFLTGGCLTDDFVHAAYVEGRSFVDLLFQPDAFGFYRPLPSALFLLDRTTAAADCPGTARVLNLALHVANVVLVFLLARRLIEWPGGPLVAAALFALTPKAATVAVFWISARAELLMTLFVLLACLCWHSWTRDGRTSRLISTAACYLLAMLSKETAVLLPLVLIAYPGTRARRLYAPASALVITLLIAWRLRSTADAVTGPLGQAGYAVNLTVWRWTRNLSNYFTRAALVPITAIALTARWASVARALGTATHRQRGSLLLFGSWWWLVFTIPALPLETRSEIRIYLPVAGLALATAALLASLPDAHQRRQRLAAAACVIVLLYQTGRSVQAAADARFSRRVVDAIASVNEVRTYRGAVALVAADAVTSRRLEDAIGGYATQVVQRAAGLRDSSPVSATIARDAPPGTLVLRCSSTGECVVAPAVSAARP